MVIVVLLFAAALSAAGFVVIYGFDRLGNRTQLLGLALALAFAFLATALITMGKLLVANEEKEEDYPGPGDPQEEEAIDQIVHEAGSPVTRKKLLATAGTAAGGALAVAAITPALSLGPWAHTDALYRTPWRRGRRLVDADGRPLRADDIGESFYTAFPEGARHDDIAAPVVVVRIDPASLQLPAERSGWAPEGILAFSKICTHAGCAIALYRKPKFSPVQPRPALICPCHYSTFDPARAAAVTFGPAGRALPQLPLAIDPARELRAAGNFSGPPGPSWSGVRARGTQS
jgi:ubiquinol-cytochrome c reductase iron-sulfur subunit